MEERHDMLGGTYCLLQGLLWSGPSMANGRSILFVFTLTLTPYPNTNVMNDITQNQSKLDLQWAGVHSQGI